jgi:hypothetical protein
MFNIGFQSESSTGKSYIPLELARYFDEPNSEQKEYKDRRVMEIAGASPTAFFYETGTWDEVLKVIVVDLESRILIFLDQPDYRLLEKLRPLLSHDKKELLYKATDKTKSQQHRTKNVIVRGYPTVHFCTVKMTTDQQEKTRMFLLSPEVTQNKLEESIKLLAVKLRDRDKFKAEVEHDPKRKWLMERVQKIYQLGIKNIIIPPEIDLYKIYKEKHEHFKPRDQRDFPRVISLAKAHALLNAFTRTKTEAGLIAIREDVEAGFELYAPIAQSNELGLPPALFEVYNNIFVPLFELDKTGDDNRPKNQGVSKEELLKKYWQIYHKPLDPNMWRFLVPSLQASGLVREEPDIDDRRKMRYYSGTYENDIKTTKIDGFGPSTYVSQG